MYTSVTVHLCSMYAYETKWLSNDSRYMKYVEHSEYASPLLPHLQQTQEHLRQPTRRCLQLTWDRLRPRWLRLLLLLPKLRLFSSCDCCCRQTWLAAPPCIQEEVCYWNPWSLFRKFPFFPCAQNQRHDYNNGESNNMKYESWITIFWSRARLVLPKTILRTRAIGPMT